MKQNVLYKEQLESNKNENKINKNDAILFGNRIPKDYFLTSGTGESDITIHAGSFHHALKNAGIEMCNFLTYSSILPGIANEINKTNNLLHGSVMESIMAIANSSKGKLATAGITYGWLYDRDDGSKYGGLVCEYNGNKTEEEAVLQLEDSLHELYENGYSEKYELQNIKKVTISIVPEKKYGTALVALCFVNYVFPIIGEV